MQNAMRFLFTIQCWSYCILILCFSTKTDCHAQVNLNIYNGLNSNHAYSMVIDKYGYLWVSTTKGVARYNGYDLKMFNGSNGMANSDVYELHPDNKGRIWTASISNTFGYIKNDRYKAVLVSRDRPMYPVGFFSYDSGVVFTLRAENAVFKETRDTVLRIPTETAGSFSAPFLYMSQQTDSLLVEGRFDGKQINMTRRYYIHEHIYRIIKENLQITAFRHLQFFYKPKRKLIYIFDFKNGVLRDISRTYSHKNISFIHCPYQSNGRRERINMIGERQIDVMDSNFRHLRTYNVRALTGDNSISGYDISYFLEDSFWGNCISTKNKGAFIGVGHQASFRKITGRIPYNFKFVGAADSFSYWYDMGQQRMMRFDNADMKGLQIMPQSEHLNKIIQYEAERVLTYTKEKSILLAFDPFWFNDKTGEITPFLAPFKHVQGYERSFRAIDGAIGNNETAYFITSSFLAGYRFKNDTLHSYVIDSTRYSGIGYDKIRQILYAYTKSKILFYQEPGKKLSITTDLIQQMGINNIEKVIMDKYGNVFLHDNDRLLIFNLGRLHYKQILKNYNLEDAKIELRNNLLVAAGKFGALFCPILGAGVVSEPTVYHNIKNSYYTTLSGMHMKGDNLIMHTDSGLYSLDIPTGSMQQHRSAGLPFKFVLGYRDDVFNFRSGDTLSMIQGERRLQFDVIRPAGNGKIRYAYQIMGTSDNWNDLNANELTLPQLEPGKYYRLSVKMKDDVWISNPIILQLYILPYWWQKAPGRQIVWALIIIAIVTVVTGTALITRRVIIINEQKRSDQLALELKSIYAQINPHFIYNTLSSALLLIHNNKTTEAYTHISKFSRLLRAYVKSSRNKYIPLNEEVINLKHYIELQQTRFKDKFEYSITIDEAINAEVTLLPSLLLQPFVENAINHGLVHLKTRGFLSVRFRQKRTNELECIIEDNGVGRNAARQLKDTSAMDKESYGNELIKDLVSIFKKYEQMQISIRYTDKPSPHTGTIVEIIIKKAAHD